MRACTNCEDPIGLGEAQRTCRRCAGHLHEVCWARDHRCADCDPAPARPAAPAPAATSGPPPEVPTPATAPGFTAPAPDPAVPTATTQTPGAAVPTATTQTPGAAPLRSAPAPRPSGPTPGPRRGPPPAVDSTLSAGLVFGAIGFCVGLGSAFVLPPPLNAVAFIGLWILITMVGTELTHKSPLFDFSEQVVGDGEADLGRVVAECTGCRQGIRLAMPQLRCSRCDARYHDACWQRLGRCGSSTCHPDRPQVQQRSTAEIRCPYCHDDLPEPDAAGCAACATRYHTDCLAEAGCVVLGCQQGRAPSRQRA